MPPPTSPCRAASNHATFCAMPDLYITMASSPCTHADAAVSGAAHIPGHVDQVLRQLPDERPGSVLTTWSAPEGLCHGLQLLLYLLLLDLNRLCPGRGPHLCVLMSPSQSPGSPCSKVQHADRVTSSCCLVESKLCRACLPAAEPSAAYVGLLSAATMDSMS